ncbi:hypothetical protein [Endozoicomonas lisbonensis]
MVLVLFLSPPALSSPVLGRDTGYHQEGMVIGQLSRVEISGFFIKPVVINFLLGGGISLDRFYPTKQFQFSVKDKLNPIYNKLVNTPPNKQVILHYVSPIPLSAPYMWLFYGASAFATDVSDVSNFTQSDSFNSYGNFYKDESYIGFGSYGVSVRSGKFVRVFRWGSFGSKLCTADLHEGGEKIEKKYVYDRVYTGSDQKGQPQYRTKTRTIHEKKPNINHLNIYTEEGCKFAEDALAANQNVTVEVSTKYFPLQDWYPDTIHSIRTVNGANTPLRIPNQDQDHLDLPGLPW